MASLGGATSFFMLSNIAFAIPSIEKLAYAIAKGLIEHIQSNADVTGVQITVGSQVYTQTNTGKVE